MACGRILKALRSAGVDATMMVRNEEGGAPGVVSVGNALQKQWCFLSERASIWVANGFSKKNLFYVDTASAGIDITATAEFQEADVIHLHWVNQGFISLRGLKRIVSCGKPVVWTMHDMWPFTGICHHADGCTKYTSGCSDCPLLPKRGCMDLAKKTFSRKFKALQQADISFVGCSRWLTSLCSTGAIAAGHRVVSIPNPIDTAVYTPADKADIRKKLGLPTDRKLILFCSVKTTDVRKGMDYFLDACRILKENSQENIEAMILGRNAEVLGKMLPIPYHAMGYVTGDSTLAELYNAADVFVTPSLQENLPNTIMEALSCGIPCVGFDIGGIPEMIDNRQNGYVAQYKSAEDLARGILWVLCEADYRQLSRCARAKVLADYSERTVAEQYISLYK